MFCFQCGRQIDDDSRYCRHCGAEQKPLPEDATIPGETAVQVSEEKPSESTTSPWLFVVIGGVILFVVIFASLGGRTPPPSVNDPIGNIAMTDNLIAEVDVSADPGSVVSNELTKASNWTYSTDEDKVRGTKTYFARTTSTNSIRQDSPYDSATTMDIMVRESGAYGTDVILTISSGQMMCPSYDGCTATVRFDDGPAQTMRFNGPSDNSSETIFVVGARSFIARLKKTKRVVIEKTLYQAGNPQFEFNVEGLKWDH